MAGAIFDRSIAKKTLNAVSAVALNESGRYHSLYISDILNRINSLDEFIATNPHNFDRLLANAKRLDNISNQQIGFMSENISGIKDLRRFLKNTSLAFSDFSENLIQHPETIFAITRLFDSIRRPASSKIFLPPPIL